jgi:hypothetical protein
MKSIPMISRQLGYLFLTALAERKDNLYLQHVSIAISFIFTQLQKWSVQVRYGSSLLVHSLHTRRRNFSLPSAVIISCFRVIFGIKSSSPFWKTSIYWWITPIFTKIPFITKQPIGFSLFTSYPGQMSLYPYLYMFTNLFWKSHGNCGSPARAKSLAKFACGHFYCLFTAKAYEHSNHSFRLVPCVWITKHKISKVWTICKT